MTRRHETDGDFSTAVSERGYGDTFLLARRERKRLGPNRGTGSARRVSLSILAGGRGTALTRPCGGAACQPPHTPQELGGHSFPAAQGRVGQGLAAKEQPAKLGGLFWQAARPGPRAGRCLPKSRGTPPARNRARSLLDSEERSRLGCPDLVGHRRPPVALRTVTFGGSAFPHDPAALRNRRRNTRDGCLSSLGHPILCGLSLTEEERTQPHD
jgi:hypothetical protein